jgi:CRP-like cAMP-binding protein
MRNNGSLAFSYLGSSKSIRAQSTSQQYQSGQTIFDQGDLADAIFYIQDGNAKLTVVSKSGKKAVIAILRCGDFFGESCMTSRTLRTSSATAIRESTIIRVKRSDIIHILQHEPAFAKLFTSHLLFRIGRIEEDLVDQVCNSSEKRLARVLLILADFGNQSDMAAGVPKIDQETLAEMVGTTRSRVSFFMNRFRARGYIDYNGRLHVHEALQTFLFEG